MSEIYQSEKDRLSNMVDDIHVDQDQERSIRAIKREKRKAYEAYKKLPYDTKMAFFCQACQEDFVIPAYRRWSTLHEIGTWQSFCPYCDSEVYRHITSRTEDPYNHLSNKTVHLRSSAARDILQPDEYGFNTLYGDPYEDLYNRYQNKEEELDYQTARHGLVDRSNIEADQERQIEEELREIYL